MPSTTRRLTDYHRICELSIRARHISCWIWPRSFRQTPCYSPSWPRPFCSFSSACPWPSPVGARQPRTTRLPPHRPPTLQAITIKQRSNIDGSLQSGRWGWVDGLMEGHAPSIILGGAGKSKWERHSLLTWLRVWLLVCMCHCFLHIMAVGLSYWWVHLLIICR